MEVSARSIGGTSLGWAEERYCRRRLDLPSIDPRHREIGQHSVERPRLDQPQGRLTVICFFHLKVFGFEPVANYSPQRRLVFNHQHAGLSSDRPMTGTQVKFH